MPRKSVSSLKPIPAFKSEADERAFWMTHDSTDYLDLSKAQRVTLPDLKSGTYSMSLRSPAHMLEGIKRSAKNRDVQ